MPELPEVETCRRGIAPHIVGQDVVDVVIRNPALRWPVPADLPALLERRRILAVDRRAKYLLLRFRTGTLILHLGMSGSLRICDADAPPRKHDHVDLVMASGKRLRMHDPRRFGCMLWTDGPAEQHSLLRQLGPEPLGEDFDGAYLHRVSRQRKTPVKTFIMNSHVVVGVGNIYASESLFLAGIHPRRLAGAVSRRRYDGLADAIRRTLSASIEQGGTTLRDFVNEDSKPGYFAQQLLVYGKAGDACRQCGRAIRQIRQQQRSTFYCPCCQR